MSKVIKKLSILFAVVLSGTISVHESFHRCIDEEDDCG